MAVRVGVRAVTGVGARLELELSRLQLRATAQHDRAVDRPDEHAALVAVLRRHSA